tara:strand:- start:1022 stop:1318 length:297 start_codon:yes stop_codon:yes gene_type:complete
MYQNLIFFTRFVGESLQFLSQCSPSCRLSNSIPIASVPIFIEAGFRCPCWLKVIFAILIVVKVPPTRNRGIEDLKQVLGIQDWLSVSVYEAIVFFINT